MSGNSLLESIEKDYGSDIAGDLCKDISLYSMDETPLSTIEASVVSAIHRKIAQYATEGTPLKEATFSLPVAVTD